MGAILYVYQAVVLIISLLSPAKRKLTLERWKKMKSHQLVYEIGYGIIGLMILTPVLLLLLAVVILIILTLLKAILSI